VAFNNSMISDNQGSPISLNRTADNSRNQSGNDCYNSNSGSNSAGAVKPGEKDLDCSPKRERTYTANFGSAIEMMEQKYSFRLQKETEKAAKASSQQVEEEKKAPATFAKPTYDIFLREIVTKKTKMFFYAQRELVLLTNGSFGYFKKKDSNQIKLLIKPTEISRVERTKN